MLLGYQPLTDGICDDVLDMVEGIAGGLKKYMIQTRKCIHKKESERCDTSGY